MNITFTVTTSDGVKTPTFKVVQLTNEFTKRSSYYQHDYDQYYNSVGIEMPNSTFGIHSHLRFLFARNKSTNKICCFHIVVFTGNISPYLTVYHPLFGDKGALYYYNSSGSELLSYVFKYKSDVIKFHKAALNTANMELIYIAFSEDEAISWIAENMFSITHNPVYKDNTKINYTDGTYEIVDDVLSEQQVKDHAYKNLLNTYGTFYKATEQEIASYYNK